MPTFNGDTLTITLDSGVTQVDVQDVYKEWKDWMLATPLNRGYPAAFRTIGGDPLSLIINVGAYFFIQNTFGWRMKPPEEDITIYLAGNLAAEDSEVELIVPTTGDFTAAIIGIQPVTQGVTPELKATLDYSSYNNGVTIDITSDNTGTIHPVGTDQAPVNNLIDGIVISLEHGFSIFYIMGDISLDDADGDLSDYIFIGQSPTKTHIDIADSANVDACEFIESHVTGTLDGNSTIRNCLIDNLNYVNGFVSQCLIDPGIIVLGGGGTAHFLDCWSGVPGLETPTIDLGGTGQSLGLRNYNGGIKLVNKSGPESVSLDINSGQVILDSTLTNGTIVVRGIGKLTDNSNGATIVADDYVNPGSIADATWNRDIVDNQVADSFGEMLGKKLLTFSKYLGLK